LNARILDDNGGNDGVGLLINQNNTIRGVGQIGVNSLTLDNKTGGTILADSAAGGVLIVNPGTGGMTNAGLMQASGGGILALDNGSYDNTGGTIEALDGSTVELRHLSSVSNGELTTTGTGVIATAIGATVSLTDVSIDGTVRVTNNSRLSLFGTINNQSNTIEVNTTGNTTDIWINSSDGVTLTGGGEVVLTGSFARIRDINGATNGIGVLTNQDNTIRGVGKIGDNATTLANQAGGIILADSTTGGVLLVDPSSSGGMTNAGLMGASGGGVLSLSGNGGGTFTNTGIFEALDDSTFQMITNASLTNLVSGTLTGGTYRSVDGGSGATMTMLGTAVDTIANGTTTVELSGAGATMTFAGTDL
ncbi:MAG: hypothetical protein MI741_03220, partial [Rhodospirillales bacterium]|nr:hypothetical protein [Rhodospirillales bacterium]